MRPVQTSPPAAFTLPLFVSRDDLRIADARAHAARAFYRVSCRRRALVVAVTLYSAHSRNCGDTTPNPPPPSPATPATAR